MLDLAFGLTDWCVLASLCVQCATRSLRLARAALGLAVRSRWTPLWMASSLLCHRKPGMQGADMCECVFCANGCCRQACVRGRLAGHGALRGLHQWRCGHVCLGATCVLTCVLQRSGLESSGMMHSAANTTAAWAVCNTLSPHACTAPSVSVCTSDSVCMQARDRRILRQAAQGRLWGQCAGGHPHPVRCARRRSATALHSHRLAQGAGQCRASGGCAGPGSLQVPWCCDSCATHLVSYISPCCAVHWTDSPLQT
jgi:hypothetical protein